MEWYESPSILVDQVAEEFWPADPDRGGPKACGLTQFYTESERVLKIFAGSPDLYRKLRDFAASLPNTKKAR